MNFINEMKEKYAFDNKIMNDIFIKLKIELPEINIPENIITYTDDEKKFYIVAQGFIDIHNWVQKLCILKFSLDRFAKSFSKNPVYQNLKNITFCDEVNITDKNKKNIKQYNFLQDIKFLENQFSFLNNNTVLNGGTSIDISKLNVDFSKIDMIDFKSFSIKLDQLLKNNDYQTILSKIKKLKKSKLSIDLNKVTRNEPTVKEPIDNKTVKVTVNEAIVKEPIVKEAIDKEPIVNIIKKGGYYHKYLKYKNKYLELKNIY